IVVKKSGTYYITVSNTECDSTKSNAIKITFHPSPQPQILVSDTIICENDSARLSLSKSYSVIQWSNGENSQIIYVMKDGMYSVTVIDSNGCVGTASQYVKVVPNPEPVITKISPSVSCVGDSIFLETSPTYSEFYWYNADKNQLVSTGKNKIKITEDGHYYVTVKNAYSAIIDGNVTTLLTGIVLYIFGSGPVQGFATTLIIGILTSLFSAIFISRLIFLTMMRKNWNISFYNSKTKDLLANAGYLFIKAKKKAYIISGIIILIGLISLFTKGLNFGVDFTGGRTYIVRFDQNVKVNDVRSSLKAVFGESPEVKTFGGENQVKITTKYKIDDNSTTIDSVIQGMLYTGLKGFYKTSINESDFDMSNVEIGLMNSQKVGPTIADDVKRAAVWAMLFALLGIFIYIAIRFKKWQYGLGGVIALFHDSIIVISMFSLFSSILPFNMEVDQAFIAAILTIIGYSINDTVIIFDRIREWNFLYPKRDLATNMNGAMNSTLGRTLNTAGTTAITLLAMFLLGGEIIRGFIFALLMGVIIGTYSSIFIATPVAHDLIMWAEKKKAKKVLAK
ncbi:MAG: protein-export membrane protein SecF, partial [Bacteroidetes bacterium RIFOXYB2_FULL_35_7]